MAEQLDWRRACVCELVDGLGLDSPRLEALLV
jgi:hypothetical protein